jgi:hypothetical protein
MKFIREYRTTSSGKYVYDFEVTGMCTDTDPNAFNLIAIPGGRIPIAQTKFLELWNYADNCEMQIEVTTKFEFRRMNRLKTGIFKFEIVGVAACDAATIVLKFGDYINRDH